MILLSPGDFLLPWLSAKSPLAPTLYPSLSQHSTEQMEMTFLLKDHLSYLQKDLEEVTFVSILGTPTCPQNLAGFKFHQIQHPCSKCSCVSGTTQIRENGLDCWSTGFSAQTLVSWGKYFLKYIFNYIIYFSSAVDREQGNSDLLGIQIECLSVYCSSSSLSCFKDWGSLQESQFWLLICCFDCLE